MLKGIERSCDSRPFQYFSIGFIDCELSFVMIRQDIWDSCVKIAKKYIEFWNPLKMTNDDKSIPYEISSQKYTDCMFDIFLKELEMDPWELFKKIEKSDVFHYTNFGEPRMSDVDYRKICSEKKTDKSFLDNVKKQWSEYQMIERFLSYIRKGWMIQAGAGSQNDDWQMHSDLSKTIMKICKGKIEEEEN